MRRELSIKKKVVMSSVEKNMGLMKTLDDAWKSQDWETFRKRHAENVAVFWPGKPEPTRGRPSHEEEAIESSSTTSSV
ncbi:MAG: ester cyclase [Candidatus Manganitrophus sp. SA1]|nr:ester cyclase [Candidatus Manganitrophus morganii]